MAHMREVLTPEQCEKMLTFLVLVDRAGKSLLENRKRPKKAELPELSDNRNTWKWRGEEVKKRIISDFKTGLGFSELALKYKGSVNAIIKFLRREGVIHVKGKEKEIIEQYLEGKTMLELARSYGVTRTVIYNLLSQNKIKIRRR